MTSLRYLADRVAAALPIRRLAITHADAEDVDAFLALLEPIFPTEKTITAYMGPVAGAHLGPGRSRCPSSGDEFVHPALATGGLCRRVPLDRGLRTT